MCSTPLPRDAIERRHHFPSSFDMSYVLSEKKSILFLICIHDGLSSTPASHVKKFFLMHRRRDARQSIRHESRVPFFCYAVRRAPCFAVRTMNTITRRRIGKQRVGETANGGINRDGNFKEGLGADCAAPSMVLQRRELPSLFSGGFPLGGFPLGGFLLPGGSLLLRGFLLSSDGHNASPPSRAVMVITTLEPCHHQAHAHLQ